MVYGIGRASIPSFDANRDSGISPILVLAVIKVMVELGRLLRCIGTGSLAKGTLGGRAGGASWTAGVSA
jgi:hypothetical protein